MLAAARAAGGESGGRALPHASVSSARRVLSVVVGPASDVVVVRSICSGGGATKEENAVVDPRAARGGQPRGRATAAAGGRLRGRTSGVEVLGAKSSTRYSSPPSPPSWWRHASARFLLSRGRAAVFLSRLASGLVPPAWASAWELWTAGRSPLLATTAAIKLTLVLAIRQPPPTSPSSAATARHARRRRLIWNGSPLPPPDLTSELRALRR